MRLPINRPTLSTSIALGIFLGLAGVVASGQPPAGRQGGPGGPGGPGGMRGGGMGGGRGGMRGMGRAMTAATTPVPALAAELKLSDRQQKEITGIQDKFRKDMMGMFAGGGFGGPGGPGGPRPGGPNAGGGRPGAPGGPGPRMGGPGGGMGGPGGRMGGMAPADMKKIQDLATSASAKIEGVLTPTQKKELPGALKEIGAMRQAGIPLETLNDLKLNGSQKSRIATITDTAQKDMEAKAKAANGNFQVLGPAFQESRQKTHASVMAVLTSPQKAIIDKYEKDHPRRGRGGPGGGGGFGGGRGPGGGGPGGPPRI